MFIHIDRLTECKINLYSYSYKHSTVIYTGIAGIHHMTKYTVTYT